MTATERVRELLDERGVEYSREGCETFFKNYHIWAIDKKRLCLSMTNLTPEQAVAATLGAGTCHITDNGPWGYPHVCSACGAAFDPDVNGGEVNYCPNCGRKVVDE